MALLDELRKAEDSGTPVSIWLKHFSLQPEAALTSALTNNYYFDESNANGPYTLIENWLETWGEVLSRPLDESLSRLIKMLWGLPYSEFIAKALGTLRAESTNITAHIATQRYFWYSVVHIIDKKSAAVPLSLHALDVRTAFMGGREQLARDLGYYSE